MGKILFLTGKPGIGKTTLFRKVLEATPLTTEGFFTLEARGDRNGGSRIGFKIVRFIRNSAGSSYDVIGERVIAHVQKEQLIGGGGPMVGKYYVDVAAVDSHGTIAVQNGCQDPSLQLLMVDEIG
eukprot:PhF_6_TR44139/c0_g1_i2/m.67470/K06928/NTPCR; nucleoside-triphosphatase